MFLSGIIFLLLGLAATSALAFSGAFLVLVLGWLAISGGIVQIISAFAFRSFGGFFAEIFFGLLTIALGLTMISAPVLVGSLIALVVVVGFMTDALLGGVRAIMQRRKGWLMVVLINLLMIILGAIILLNPALLITLLGLLVGANLFVRGVVLLLSALDVRARSRRTT